MTNAPRTFAGEARTHMGLVVSDLDASVRFYEALFHDGPVKLRSDYAKFEVDELGLNLSLVKGTPPPGAGAGLHFGVEVKDLERVEREASSMEAAGLEPKFERETECCYARQNKFWVRDPDGYAWEVFQVLGDVERLSARSEGTTCCCSTSDACA